MYWYTPSIWPQIYKIQILLESVLCTNLYTEEHTWITQSSELCDIHCYLLVLLSTTGNTVTTVPQTHLELQESHPKFLWVCQWPLPLSKSVRSQFFFQPSAGPPPPNPWFGILIPPSCSTLVVLQSVSWVRIFFLWQFLKLSAEVMKFHTQDALSMGVPNIRIA